MDQHDRDPPHRQPSGEPVAISSRIELALRQLELGFLLLPVWGGALRARPLVKPASLAAERPAAEPWKLKGLLGLGRSP